jgi:membrane-bound lytic murein transglycosylase F
VAELLVGRRGEPSPPKGPAELVGRTVTVRRSSSYRESLDALVAGEAKGVLLADAAEDMDTEHLIQEVAQGRLAYTVADSDLFDHIQAYSPEVVALFPIREGRQIAFGLRPQNPKLKAAADAFLVQSAMTTHARVLKKDDLVAIRERGSIRMLTRNNAVSYFLHRGNQQGFDYELMKMFARAHGLRLDVIVPADGADLLPWLEEGRGDVVAAQLTITEARKARFAFSEPYLHVDELLIQRAGEPPITELAALKGRTIHVRRSSSHRATLDELRRLYGPFTLVDAPEELETEQLIAMVARGEIPLTVADSNVAAAELTWRGGFQATLPLKRDVAIAWAVRKENTALRAELDAFAKKVYRGLEYNVLKKQYFESSKLLEAVHEDAARATGSLSPYDDLIKKRAKQYGLDWRLLAAQAYQESRFDPEAKSWVGALGVFQVMPATGREMGFEDLADPDQGIHAGVRYLSRLIDQFDKKLPFKQRVRFALAAYNVGKGHVEDARRLARGQGLDPDKWFGHVEKAMLLLQQPQYAKKARHGYCRGEEPVKYVSEIQSRYENYLTVVKDF